MDIKNSPRKTKNLSSQLTNSSKMVKIRPSKDILIVPWTYRKSEKELQDVDSLVLNYLGC